MSKLRLFTYLCNRCVPADVRWRKNVQKVPRARCATCGKIRPCFRIHL